MGKWYLFNVYTFAYLYVLLTRGVVYMGIPYIFFIYVITCGWLGRDANLFDFRTQDLHIKQSMKHKAWNTTRAMTSIVKTCLWYSKYVDERKHMHDRANSNTAETLLKRVTSPGDRNVNKPSRWYRGLSHKFQYILKNVCQCEWQSIVCNF